MALSLVRAPRGVHLTEFSDQLAAAGAVRPLKEALEVESPRVQKNAAGALANMSRNQAVLDHLLDAGVVPALLRLLRSDDTRVVRQVMRNLHSCAVHPKARYVASQCLCMQWRCAVP